MEPRSRSKPLAVAALACLGALAVVSREAALVDAEAPTAYPVALAVAWVVAPIMLGAMCAALLGRASVLVGVAATPLAVAAMALDARPAVGFWDATALAVLFGAGVALARVDAGTRRHAGVVALVALLVSEGVVRRFAPAPPTFPDPAFAHPLLGRSQLDLGCSTMLDERPYEVREGRRVTPRPRSWLHVGDSMVAGSGVRADDTFTSALDRRHPDVWNTRAGFPGTSLDAQWLWLHRHLRALGPERVVLYPLVLNDLAEMDRPYTCCDLGPIAAFGPSGPAARCEAPRWRVPLRTFVARSPAPYPLRVATAASFLARHVVASASRWGSALETAVTFDTNVGSEDQWAHWEQALVAVAGEARAAGAALTVVVLPSRLALASPDPEATEAARTRDRMLAITRRHGIDALDAWPLFAEVVARDGPAPWFVTPPAWDCHLSPAGHARLAAFLDARLGTRVAP